MAISFCSRCGKEALDAFCLYCSPVRIQIDDITALRLYRHSKGWVPKIPGKVFDCCEDVNANILGVPCIVRFGFSSKNKCLTELVTSSCVWIFSCSSQDFFGAIYLPVNEEVDVSSTLNLAIELAIEQAISNPKFETVQASLAPR